MSSPSFVGDTCAAKEKQGHWFHAGVHRPTFGDRWELSTRIGRRDRQGGGTWIVRWTTTSSIFEDLLEPRPPAMQGVRATRFPVHHGRIRHVAGRLVFSFAISADLLNSFDDRPASLTTREIRNQGQRTAVDVDWRTLSRSNICARHGLEPVLACTALARSGRSGQIGRRGRGGPRGMEDGCQSRLEGLCPA